jgi:IS5 family transposase
VRRRAHSIAARLRRRNDEARVEVLAITGELADIAEATITDALAVAHNAKRALLRAGTAAPRKAVALVAEIEKTVKLLEQIIAQARTRIAGEIPDGSTRIVSLHDPGARPIAKGRLAKPVEFGYKVQVTDNVDGIVLDLSVHQGNPADAPMLVPAIMRVKALFGRAPSKVTADRGYGEASVESGLSELGVNYVAIPRKGKPGSARRSVESSRRFRTLIKWRTGSEGRISHLKHAWGFDRSLLDGTEGATTWCGWGVLAHNSAKIAALGQQRTVAPPRRTPARPSIEQAGTGPPTGRSPTPSLIA